MSRLSLHDFYDCHLYAFSIASELYLRVQISENIHSGLFCHGKQLRIILKFKVQLSNTLSFKEVISSINKSFNNLPPKIWFNRLHQLWLYYTVFKYFKKFSYVRKLLVLPRPISYPKHPFSQTSAALQLSLSHPGQWFLCQGQKRSRPHWCQ